MSKSGAVGSTAVGAKSLSATEPPTYALRPGVVFPDWSAVASSAAREALATVLSAFDPARRWDGYGDEEDRVRRAVIEGLAELGRGPDAAWIGARTGFDKERVEALLARLTTRDLVVRDRDSGEIVGAYPLTMRPTEHRVLLRGRIVHAMCAVDALGVGAMFGADVVIRSRCRACGDPIHIATKDQGDALDYVEPGSTLVWSGNRYEGACAATSLCTVIAFFCSAAHLEEWRGANDPGTEGYRLSPEEAMQVGRALFSPVLRAANGAVGRTA